MQQRGCPVHEVHEAGVGVGAAQQRAGQEGRPSDAALVHLPSVGIVIVIVIVIVVVIVVVTVTRSR